MGHTIVLHLGAVGFKHKLIISITKAINNIQNQTDFNRIISLLIIMNGKRIVLKVIKIVFTFEWGNILNFETKEKRQLNNKEQIFYKLRINKNMFYCIRKGSCLQLTSIK